MDAKPRTMPVGRVSEILLDDSMSAMLDQFKTECRLQGMNHGSINSYASAMRIFMSFLMSKNKTPTEVDKDLLKLYIDYLLSERKVAYRTLSYNFSALASFYDWLLFDNKIEENPVQAVRKRYLKRYKNGEGMQQEGRKLISVEQMAMLVRSIISIEDRAVVLMLAKTGVRRNELINIDIDDIDWDKMSVKLKPTAKRSNRLVFFDEETKRVLKDWMNMRRLYVRSDTKALFVSQSGGRLNKNHVYDIVVKHAQQVGLHNPNSERLDDHFTPHCCRHWFTTHLRRAGMQREHIQELRGDSRPDAIDIYYHIDPEDLRLAYLAFIPKLGLS
ncbi:MAG: tyrosine-type recombinase/integrase [Methanomassiliicoccales archaeon]|jgi:integrase/recombinase XerD